MARYGLKKSKQKMSGHLGCEYFKTERAGNSSCSDMSKKSGGYPDLELNFENNLPLVLTLT